MDRLINWLYFNDCEWGPYRLIKIKGLNTFLVENKCGSRKTVSPVWDLVRIKNTFNRLIGLVK